VALITTGENFEIKIFRLPSAKVLKTKLFLPFPVISRKNGQKNSVPSWAVNLSGEPQRDTKQDRIAIPTLRHFQLVCKAVEQRLHCQRHGLCRWWTKAEIERVPDQSGLSTPGLNIFALINSFSQFSNNIFLLSPLN